MLVSYMCFWMCFHPYSVCILTLPSISINRQEVYRQTSSGFFIFLLMRQYTLYRHGSFLILKHTYSSTFTGTHISHTLYIYIYSGKRNGYEGSSLGNFCGSLSRIFHRQCWEQRKETQQFGFYPNPELFSIKCFHNLFRK